VATRVGVVVVGDEVLKAEIAEANMGFMLSELNAWGAEVVLAAILPDRADVVARHLRLYRGEADLLALTGGIGPTPDDITREAVARAAGVPLVVHPEARAALEAYYGGRMNPYRLLMATVPEGAVLIPNPVSAAPGFCVAGMAAFPGIPRLLRAMFGWLRPMIRGRRMARVTLYGRAPESAFAGIMEQVMREFPDVSVGSYPMTEGEYRVRVVFRGEEPGRTAACADRFGLLLAEAGLSMDERTEEAGDGRP